MQTQKLNTIDAALIPSYLTRLKRFVLALDALFLAAWRFWKSPLTLRSFQYSISLHFHWFFASLSHLHKSSFFNVVCYFGIVCLSLTLLFVPLAFLSLLGCYKLPFLLYNPIVAYFCWIVCVFDASSFWNFYASFSCYFVICSASLCFLFYKYLFFVI